MHSNQYPAFPIHKLSNVFPYSAYHQFLAATLTVIRCTVTSVINYVSGF